MTTAQTTQTAASTGIVIIGNIKSGDTLKLKFKSFQLPNNINTISVTANSGDNADTIAYKFVNLINDDQVFKPMGVTATCDGTNGLNVYWVPGPLGELAFVDFYASTSSNTNKATFHFSGGDGFITATDDFAYLRKRTNQFIQVRKGDTISKGNFLPEGNFRNAESMQHREFLEGWLLTPYADFRFVYNGATISFKNGRPLEVDYGLMQSLIANYAQIR